MDADFNFILIGAFAGGLLSFFSPCILPLVPVYISYLGGTANPGRFGIFINAFLFVLGFALVFTFFGVGVGVLGQFLVAYLDTIRLVSVVLLVIFGLMLLDIIHFPYALFRNKNPADTSVIKNHFLMSFAVGIMFAFAWTPCVSLVLGSILTLAVTFSDWQQSTLLLAAYSTGLGLPFLVVALVPQWIRKLKILNPYLGKFQKVAGIMLIIMAFAIYTGILPVFVRWLTVLTER